MRVTTFSKQANLPWGPQNYIQNITHVQIQDKNKKDRLSKENIKVCMFAVIKIKKCICAHKCMQAWCTHVQAHKHVDS